jgi:hypothetical protein
VIGCMFGTPQEPLRLTQAIMEKVVPEIKSHIYIKRRKYIIAVLNLPGPL